MLIRFNVKNFLSFSTREGDKSQEFSMIAGKVRSKKDHIYDDGKIKLLKFAAVYGANASGKSNLVKAIEFMKETILKGLPKGHTGKYCKIDPINKDKESYFEFELLVNDRYYSYGFEVVLNSSRFLTEWLVELTADGREKEVFTRNIKEGKFDLGKEFKDPQLIQKLNVYADDIKNDESALLLSIMNQYKKNLYREHTEAALFQNIYGWLQNCLDINYPDKFISDYSYMANSENIDEVYRIIAAFGTGITNFEMVPVSVEKIFGKLPSQTAKDIIEKLEQMSSQIKNKRLKEDPAGIDRNQKSGLIMRSKEDFFIIENDLDGKPIGKTIQFSHGEKNVLFNLNEESDGTIRILDLIEVLINKNGNKVYIIDELDRCLHPSLSYKFVETFLQLAETRNIQLIVTTHESRLMNFDLLRRDEIWFVNKDTSGNSNIYSLEEYNSRFDQKIDKAYLEGRYGGVPVFSTVFPLKKV